MDRISRLIASVADLDASARTQVAAAAAEGQFDEVTLLTPLAKEIAELANRWGASREKSAKPLSPQPSIQTAESGEKILAPTVRSQNQEGRNSNYPQFVREKNDLVKLGWSARENAPYEHRVPKTAVDATCRAVVANGKAGHRFRMDEVNKATAKSAGNAVLPSYQIYAVISWLKWAGMIVQHGRQGYTIIRPQSFTTSVETAWLALPQR